MTEMPEEQHPIRTSCDVCGRQDATVRYVTYPYVFSLIVITFQRAFSGCWCRLHRIQRWLAASLITSIFGWLGIPYGFIFTPVRLLQLARGGMQDNVLNGRLLRAIGEEKLSKGDQAGAIRCLENSLLYVDDPAAREMLRKLYASQQLRDQPAATGLLALLALFAIPFLFAAIGMLIGLVDFGVGWLASAVISEFPIYLLILIQAPLIVSIYFCVILLSYAFQGFTRAFRVASAALLSLAGIISGLAFLNAIVVGATLGIYFSYFINGFQESLNDSLITFAAISTRAVFYVFSPQSFSSNPSGNILYAVILLISLIFLLMVLLPKMRELSTQQLRLQDIRQPADQFAERYPVEGWLGLIGFVVAGALLFMAVPQKSHVDTLEAFDHITVALGHMNAGEYDPAIVEYKLAAELKPNHPLSYIGLGYAYYQTGDVNEAENNFETALALWPESGEAQSGLGWIHLQRGEYDLAEQKFLEALRINPQSVDAHLGLGWAYLNQFDLDKSRKEFETAKSAAPEIAEAYYGLGTLYFLLSDFESAIDSLQTATKLNPNNFQAFYYTGAVYLGEDKYAEAETAFQAALKLRPDYYDALNGLGEIRVADYQFEEGMAYYDNAALADPKRIDAPLGKASVLIQIGRFQEAAFLIESLDRENEYVKPTLAYLYYQMDRKNEADKLLAEAISAASHQESVPQARAYFIIAGVYSANNDFPDARKFLELAMDTYPIEPDANSYISLSYILTALGEFDKAQNAIHQASLIGHSDLGLKLAQANLLIEQEDLLGAEREVRAALKDNADSTAAHALLALIYYHLGSLARAMGEARTAIELNPYNSDAYSQQAFVYQAAGRPEDALAAAKEALRLNPLDNASHYILGLCYMDNGMNAEAIAEFEKFLSTYQDRTYIRDYKVKAEEYLVKLNGSP